MKSWNALRNRYIENIIVEFTGPPVPPVITHAWVKYWKPPMIPMTVVKNMYGLINGTVMCQVFCHGDAPSRLAAS